LFLKNRELLKTKKEYNGRKWHVEHSQLGECPECHYPVKATDSWRGETVCKQCGLVISDRAPALPDQELMKNRSTDKINKGSKTTHDEKEALKRAGKPVINHTDMKDWRKAQKILEIDRISNQLMMTKQQREIVREIVRTHNLRNFHRRLNTDAIIAGICRYVLVKQNRVKELRYNREPFVSVGLNKQGYRVIERRLNALDDLII